MRNNVRRIGVFAAALLCAGFLGAGVHTTLEANAETEVQMTEMTYGAALRLGDNFGLRFQMTVNQEWFDSQENAKVRMLLIRETALTGELTKDTAGVYGIADGQELNNRSDVGDVYQYNAVIVDIPDYAYDQPIVARGCVELSDDSYVYTDAATIQTRSVAQVANAALTDKFDDYYMDIGKYLVREIEVEETKYVGVGATGSVDAWLDYFVNATAAVQQQFNAKTEFAFESSDPAVVKVDEKTGAFTAISGGTATVTVSAWGKTATCEITVDGNVQYKSDYSVTFPSEGDSYSVDSTTYTGGSTVSLGDGLLVDVQGKLNTNNNSYYGSWTYPYPINFANKTSSDILLDIMTVPTQTLTYEYSALYISFVDTEDPTNEVKIRLLKHSTASLSMMSVWYTQYGKTNDYKGVLDPTNANPNINANGIWLLGDMNGSANIPISFDYANRQVYTTYSDKGMQKVADLDDEAFYPTENTSYTHWKGFTNDTAYVKITMEGINSASHNSGVFVRTIADYNLADSDAQVTAKYTTNNVKDSRTTIDVDDIADEGLL